jgi:hypothetical protein
VLDISSFIDYFPKLFIFKILKQVPSLKHHLKTLLSIPNGEILSTVFPTDDLFQTSLCQPSVRSTMTTQLVATFPGVFPFAPPRVGKRETMKRLTAENLDLRSIIADLSQQIAKIDAENDMICRSLQFFQDHMATLRDSDNLS